jgi:hypothetical protein
MRDIAAFVDVYMGRVMAEKSDVVAVARRIKRTPGGNREPSRLKWSAARLMRLAKIVNKGRDWGAAAALAASLETAPSSVSRWLTGKSKPDLVSEQMLLKLEKSIKDKSGRASAKKRGVK